ncbi:hypothetical protein I545_2004 [Mycobacterium kansasii 662]|nr:hypothetical protein I547_3841 [Mycobacterium kansasii 824]EUA20159.1 hypothetical protein I545_2004 [Mycobacterium kansasii 662]KEP39997.1 hypothetical protein MKSMC1_48730 [Mycobacterium kansasii]OOK80664.1 hypothetical protein BZL29_2282 [Mycobacterium kansasii]
MISTNAVAKRPDRLSARAAADKALRGRLTKRQADDAWAAACAAVVSQN